MNKQLKKFITLIMVVVIVGFCIYVLSKEDNNQTSSDLKLCYNEEDGKDYSQGALRLTSDGKRVVCNNGKWDEAD